MNHSIKSMRRRAIVCGTILLAGGLVLLGARLGWIPEDILRSIPFIPIVMILLGAFLLVRSIMGRHGNGRQDDGARSCCAK